MRSPFLQALTAVGVGAWIKVDYEQRPFVEGMFLSFSEDANTITASVQHTPDNPDLFVNAALAVSGTTGTLTVYSPHGLVTGDSVVLTGTQGNNATGYDGQYTVASTPSTTTLTFTVASGGPAAAAPSTKASLCRVFTDATLAAKNARAYAANTVPVLASRLAVTAYTAGTAYLEIVQGHARG